MLILILALSVTITRFQCLGFLLWFLCLGTLSQSIFGISLLFLWESSRNWTTGMHIGRLYYWAMSPVCHGLSWVTLYLMAVFTGIFTLTKYLLQRFWVIDLKNSPRLQKASDWEAHRIIITAVSGVHPRLDVQYICYLRTYFLCLLNRSMWTHLVYRSELAGRNTRPLWTLGGKLTWTIWYLC